MPVEQHKNVREHWLELSKRNDLTGKTAIFSDCIGGRSLRGTLRMIIVEGGTLTLSCADLERKDHAEGATWHPALPNEKICVGIVNTEPIIDLGIRIAYDLDDHRMIMIG